jgi:hypothetical protein
MKNVNDGGQLTTAQLNEKEKQGILNISMETWDSWQSTVGCCAHIPAAVLLLIRALERFRRML